MYYKYITYIYIYLLYIYIYIYIYIYVTKKHLLFLFGYVSEFYFILFEILLNKNNNCLFSYLYTLTFTVKGFQIIDIKFTIQSNRKVVNFVDAILNLEKSSHHL